ncbi:hypothetical protein TBLA_0A04300 [Henningerozyma blattae CBS 6284]|uniref:Uncharacterized protein n=1 Tax=Henningerozyma blattae (strain ATCC 34711 / CBS 6284 / DSM 70876 / NBRC 10599 / NRRL Y-10934 / UCD 77-7) TaxID=1071380 RepID=I2GVS3_HENB6|nr:hypothetical protein TBLA_0A04300 [Tetrapisispora blattae CBS 6284]CCH58225.1 hypothetical protein TBLA_0A04300 [Tetrapisispora blattae CBS 6284]
MARSKKSDRNLLDPEVRSLADLPRAEKTDLANAFIRATAAKNGALLDAKISKKSKTKGKGKRFSKKDLERKISQTVTSMDKDRLERALKFTNKLDGKIAKSVSRAKYVQKARKAGWDSTNESIKRELRGEELQPKKKLENQDDMMMDDDDDDDNELEVMEDETEEPRSTKKQTNLFDLLDPDVEN